MNARSEVSTEFQDSKCNSPSPSTQSENSTEGELSTNQSHILTSDNIPISVAILNEVSHCEPKVKKRRKQSNPVKCHNISSPTAQLPVIESEVSRNEDDLESNKVYKEIPEEECNVQYDQPGEKAIVHTNENKKCELIPQKNISLCTASTSFNSKSRENDKVSRISCKVKDTSLQSFTDISSPDSNDEFIQNSDFKNPIGKLYPQMPPLLPLNPADLAGEASKLSSVFPTLTEFPVSLTTSGQTSTQSNRSFINASGLRIFNPEAYCELCEKEFCNKYFLKTHKANKHGICTVDTLSSFSLRGSPFKTVPLNPQIIQHTINQLNENGAAFGSTEAYCTLCQKAFCNKYFLRKHRQNIHGINESSQEATSSSQSSIHVPVISSPVLSVRVQGGGLKCDENCLELPTNSNDDIHNHSVISTKSEKNNLNSNITHVSPRNGNDSLPIEKDEGTALMLDNQEDKNVKFSCDICSIEFCDKYFLDIHKHNKHNTDSKSTNQVTNFSEKCIADSTEENIRTSNDDLEEQKENFKEQMCTPCMKVFKSAQAFQYHMLESHGASVKEEEDHHLKSPDPLNSHASSVKEESVPAELETYSSNISKKALCSNQEATDNSNSSNDSGMIYCNVCFIKFRDKNSLKIHMEIEHKINAENFSCIGVILGSGESVGTLTSSSHSDLRCNICSNTFSDKHMLKYHKQKMHGLGSDTDSSQETIEKDLLKKQNGDSFLSDKQRAITGRNFCNICNKELCNKYFMKTHMLKMHGIDVDKLSTEKAASTVSGVLCDICQKVLCSKYFLKVHKQNVHGITEETTKPSVALTSLVNDSLSQEVSDRYNENCSLSSYIPSSMSALLNQQMENENQSSKSKINVFCCDICGQEFLNKLLLQVHLVKKHINNESNLTNLGHAINPHFTQKYSGIFPQLSSDASKYVGKEIPHCSCCSYVKKGVSSLNAPDEKQTTSLNGDEKILLCHICNQSYHSSEYFQHHLLNHTYLMHSNQDSSQNLSPNSLLIQKRDVNIAPGFEETNKPKPRKVKRFRCSKCDKKFRTREKCLLHIHAMHKNKRAFSNQNAKLDHSYQQSCVSENENSLNYISPKNNLSEMSVAVKRNKNEYNWKVLKDKSIDLDANQPSALHVPYVMPESSVAASVIMQPFHLTEPKSDGISKEDVFVPSLVYLPVNQKISEPVTVAFTLTPA